MDLPRPGLSSIPVETGYAGIASLREDWFLVEQQLPVEVTQSFLMKGYRSEETNLSSILFKNDVNDSAKDYVFIENVNLGLLLFFKFLLIINFFFLGPCAIRNRNPISH